MSGKWFLVAARVVAWTVALGALFAVLSGYDSLPESLPITRWTNGPKSLLLALRVPLINLLTLGLVELLWRGLRKVELFDRAGAVAGVLLLTGALKAAIEAAQILRLPESLTWSILPLAAVLAIGMGLAAVLGRELFRGERWRELQLSRLETAAAVALVAGILALELPIVTG